MKVEKKILLLFLSALLATGLAACGGSQEQQEMSSGQDGGVLRETEGRQDGGAAQKVGGGQDGGAAQEDGGGQDGGAAQKNNGGQDDDAMQKDSGGQDGDAASENSGGQDGDAAPEDSGAMQEADSLQARKEEFALLLEETNSEKRLLNASREALDRYCYDFTNDKPKLSKKDVSIMKDYKKKKVKKRLSVAEAKKEVSWLFRLFRSQYGLYTYYGGDAVFEKQEQAIKRELGTKGDIAVKEYQKLLHRYLDFITDNHLTIGDSDFSADMTLFSNEENHYIKKDAVFYREDTPGDAIRSVNGQPPEAYFKRAIDEAGKLTYYPYTMEKTKEACRYDILYESGKREELVLKPAEYVGGGMVDKLYDCKQNDGTARIELNVMMFEDQDKYMTKEYHRFLKAVPEMKAQKNLIFDLRNNGGGNMAFVEEWFSAFTGKQPQPNYSTLRIRPVMMGGVKKMDKLAARWGMEKKGKYYYYQYPEEQYLENAGRRIFVLVSRATASSAEGFVDLANNMENTVTIGTNTGGVFTNMANYSMAMPYSRLYLEFGECLMYYDPSYFRESYGMEPDIYLTGKNLEKRLERFFEIYVTGEEK